MTFPGEASLSYIEDTILEQTFLLSSLALTIFLLSAFVIFPELRCRDFCCRCILIGTLQSVLCILTGCGFFCNEWSPSIAKKEIFFGVWQAMLSLGIRISI